jgi:hypothetical protein
MHAETIDVSQRGWNAALPKKMHQSMDAFRVVEMKVPKHSVIWYISLGMPFVASIHGWELDWIADEEYRQVIEDKVLDAFFSVELGRPPSDITDRITGAFLPTNSRDSSEDFGLLANTCQEIGIRQV